MHLLGQAEKVASFQYDMVLVLASWKKRLCFKGLSHPGLCQYNGSDGMTIRLKIFYPQKHSTNDESHSLHSPITVLTLATVPTCIILMQNLKKKKIYIYILGEKS